MEGSVFEAGLILLVAFGFNSFIVSSLFNNTSINSSLNTCRVSVNVVIALTSRVSKCSIVEGIKLLIIVMLFPGLLSPFSLYGIGSSILLLIHMHFLGVDHTRISFGIEQRVELVLVGISVAINVVLDPLEVLLPLSSLSSSILLHFLLLQVP